MKQGWECPRCKTIHAPHVNKCDCSANAVSTSSTKDDMILNGIIIHPPLIPPHVLKYRSGKAYTAKGLHITPFFNDERTAK